MSIKITRIVQELPGSPISYRKINTFYARRSDLGVVVHLDPGAEVDRTWNYYIVPTVSSELGPIELSCVSRDQV